VLFLGFEDAALWSARGQNENTVVILEDAQESGHQSIPLKIL